MPPMAPADVVLGLGSNLGDRERALEQGLRRLVERGFRPLLRSSTYLTEPVGGPPQGWFLNLVVAGASDLSAEDLLTACQDTERDLGRLPAERSRGRTGRRPRLPAAPSSPGSLRSPRP